MQTHINMKDAHFCIRILNRRTYNMKFLGMAVKAVLSLVAAIYFLTSSGILYALVMFGIIIRLNFVLCLVLQEDGIFFLRLDWGEGAHDDPALACPEDTGSHHHPLHYNCGLQLYFPQWNRCKHRRGNCRYHLPGLRGS